MHSPRLVLVGPPGAGKSTVGALVAGTLGVPLLDSDQEVEDAVGESIPAIFAARGETAFRDLEHEAVTRLLTRDGVLSLGGGAVLHAGTRAALAGRTVVYLDVAVAEAAARVERSHERPLLAGDTAERLTALMAERSGLYEAVASAVVVTDGRTAGAVAEEVLRVLPAPATTIHVSGDPGYDVLVGRGLADEVPALVGDAQRVLLAHAPATAGQARAMAAALGSAGAEVHVHALPDAEDAKTLDAVAACWELLGRHRFGRQDAVVAVGGGATTDAAGFAAASWLRGVPLVNVPTTLLGMVDAAVGGKTGINTAAGKNTVGAFHPPAGVVCDLDALATLPAADLRAGLAEVVKAGFIADQDILRLVEADGGAGALDPASPVLRELVERAVAVKAQVVGKDLRESGVREILNYGHTFAHAVERTEHYRWRHGDAVAVGMVFAAELARAAGYLDDRTVERHRHVLGLLGLPTTYRGDRWAELADAMAGDKKVRSSQLRFIVLERAGRPVVLHAPAPEHLAAAYEAVSA